MNKRIMGRYKSYFLEKTFDIDKDVDYIYNFIFKSPIQQLKNKSFDENLYQKYPNLYVEGCIFEFLKSDNFVTVECKLAHEIAPLFIFGGVLNTDSKIVLDKTIQDRNYIIISLDRDLIDYYVSNSFDFNQLKKIIPLHQLQKIKNIMKESYIKSMIYHELSHWLNNTIHNNHISKVIELAKKYQNPDILKLKTKDVNLTHFEIDAQIHGIKQTKRDYNKKWDNLTLNQLFTIYPSLSFIYDDVKEYGKEITDIWIKTLIKRMDREKLLGKNMRLPIKQFSNI